MENLEYIDNEILSKDFLSDYNIDECKKVLSMLLKKHQRLKNSCAEEVDLLITPRYEPIYSCPLPRQNNQMDKVDAHLDDIVDYRFMNAKISNIMKKMNSEEKICFTEMFLNNKSDYAVANITGRSRTGLIPYINSCIVRVVLAFHFEVLKDQTIEDLDIDQTKEIELKYY